MLNPLRPQHCTDPRALPRLPPTHPTVATSTPAPPCRYIIICPCPFAPPGSFRTTAAVVSTLAFTALAFLFLGINSFTGSNGCRLAGGWFGILAAFCAWWGAMAGFWSRDTTFGLIKLQAVGLARQA